MAPQKMTTAPMPLITDTDTLTAFCARMRAERFIAMDTEFMRDRTYWPRLCLVQVAGADPLVVMDDLRNAVASDPLDAGCSQYDVRRPSGLQLVPRTVETEDKALHGFLPCVKPRCGERCCSWPVVCRQ